MSYVLCPILCPLCSHLTLFSSNLIAGLGGGIWTVVLGDWDRDVEEGGEIEMVVDTIVVHPNFTDYQHDLAMLRLPRPLLITPVCLPPQDLPGLADDYLGLRCVATGWGQTTKEGGLEARLHQVNLRVVDNESCDEVYQLKYGVNINKGHLCAGPELGSVTGTCVVSSHREQQHVMLCYDMSG